MSTTDCTISVLFLVFSLISIRAQKNKLCKESNKVRKSSTNFFIFLAKVVQVV